MLALQSKHSLAPDDCLLPPDGEELHYDTPNDHWELIISGNTPEFAHEALFGSSLCALSKKDGGIRPVTVGSVFAD